MRWEEPEAVVYLEDNEVLLRRDDNGIVLEEVNLKLGFEKSVVRY